MSKKIIQNFIGGYSQESYTMKSDNETNYQKNTLNSIISGLSRRPGFYNICDLQLTSNDILSVNEMKYQDGFMVVDSNKNLKFFKKDGTEYSTEFESIVTEDNFINYLSGDVELGYLNLNDVTFIFNKNKKVEKTDEITLSELQQKDTFILQNIVANKKYSIEIDYSYESTIDGTEIDIPITWMYGGNVDRVHSANINTGNSSSKNIKGKISYTHNSDSISNKVFFERLFNSFSYDNFENDIFTKKTSIFNANINPFFRAYETTGALSHRKLLYRPWGETPSSFDLYIIGEYFDEDLNDYVIGQEKVEILSGWNATSGTSLFDIGSRKYRKVFEIYSSIPAYSSFYLCGENGMLLIGIKKGKQNSFVAFKPVELDNTFYLEQYVPVFYNNNFKININTISVSDEANNSNFKVIKNYVEKDLTNYTYFTDIAELPKIYTVDSIVKIKISKDNFAYYKFTPNNDSYTTGELTYGYWEEHYDIFSPYLKSETMPYTCIIDNENKKITIYDGGWFSRKVGDSENNKDPYFIGNKINDMFIYGGRLTFLSGGNKIDFSQTSSFYNFYRTTVLTEVSSDRISLNITSDKNIDIKKGLFFNQKLLLLDNDTQFVVEYDSGLSLNTLKISELSNFNSNSKLRPIKTNDSLFFVSDYGNNSQVIKFSSKDISLVYGNEVSQKVKTLLPNNITSSSVNSANDKLFLAKKGSNKIYVYEYKMFAEAGEFGAWTTFEITGYNIQNIFCYNDELFALVNENVNSTSVKLLKMNLSNDITYENNFENESFKLHLDNKQFKSISSLSVNLDLNNKQKQYLTFYYDVAYDIINTDNIRVISSGKNNCIFKYGYSFNIVDVSKNVLDNNTVITFENPYYQNASSNNDYIIDEVIVGEVFDTEIELSKVNLTDRNGLPLSGYVQLLSLSLNFSDTGGFKINTDIQNAGEYDEYFTGKIVGSTETLIGEASIETGNQVFYLGSERNYIKTKIKNIDYLPFCINSGEYELEYSSNSSSF